MEIKIISERENPLLRRKEIRLEMKSDVTPSMAKIESWIIEKYKVDKDIIKIKKIHGIFGSKIFIINVNIYESFEDKDKTEIKTKKQRNAEKKAREGKKSEENK